MHKLTILCENTAGPGQAVLGEHGFAVLIEQKGRSMLFDTGQGHTIAHNAGCLKKDLGKISAIVLSHGHYDHTGGLKHVLRTTGELDVLAHPAVFTERYAAVKFRHETTYRSIGMPHTRAELEDLGARFILQTAFTEIAQGIHVTGEAPRTAPFEKNDRRLAVRINGRCEQDTVPDDQSLVIESRRGLIVILGCAHSGMINTLNHISARLPSKSIHTVIGGTHLGFLAGGQIEATIAELKKFNLARLGVSHCTGLPPAMKLLQAFGEKFFFANAGSVITSA